MTYRLLYIERIISFEYYDGPEIGLAALTCGGHVRFDLVGESKFRMFRAFTFRFFDEDVDRKLGELFELVCNQSDRICVPSVNSVNLSKLEDLSLSYNDRIKVGVSDLSLNCVRYSDFSENEANLIKDMNTLDSYRTIHSLIKAKPL